MPAMSSWLVSPARQFSRGVIAGRHMCGTPPPGSHRLLSQSRWARPRLPEAMSARTNISSASAQLFTKGCFFGDAATQNAPLT